jgi:septal ring factor EnvC (AmiA/AmiB activator)
MTAMVGGVIGKAKEGFHMLGIVLSRLGVDEKRRLREQLESARASLQNRIRIMQDQVVEIFDLQAENKRLEKRVADLEVELTAARTTLSKVRLAVADLQLVAAEVRP